MARNNHDSQLSITSALVPVEQKRTQNGTITKLRSISNGTNVIITSQKSMRILQNTKDPRELSAKSDTRAITFSSCKSDKDGVLKTLLPPGIGSSKHTAVCVKTPTRDEERHSSSSSRHRPIYSPQTTKPKTPRPSKTPQVTKQKGDNSTKITEGKTLQNPVRESEGKSRHPDKPSEKNTATKPSKTSDKDTATSKKDSRKKPHESSRRRSSKPPQFPSEEDVNSTAKILKSRGYLMEGKLGEGTYAKVRRAYSYHHNSRVAIKIVSRSRLNARFQQKFLPRELAIVQSISHPHIIELLDMFENNGVIFLIMELARHGDLLEYVQKKNALRDSEARTVFTQILSAVEYLHSRGTFHRDLKCENVLLDWGPKGITAKITDFGFAREWRESFKPCSTFCGSAAYASPEILQAIPYDPHWADIWSLGVVLYIMITGRMPFDDNNIKEALDDMHNNRLNFSRRRLVCIEVQRLLKSILTYDARQRPGTQEIRKSPWVRGRCTMPRPSARISSSVGGV